MIIVVLHGAGEVSKRLYLSRLKAKYDAQSIEVVDFKQSSLQALNTLINSGSLFSDKRLIVVENTPDSFNLGELTTGDDSVNLVLVAASPDSSKPLLKSAAEKKVVIMPFEGEKETSAFPFLDALLEGKKSAFVELEKLREEYGWVYVLTMIYYALRRNLLPLPSSGFMQKKVIAQKSRFEDKIWPKLYEKTLQTEYAIKSGLLYERLGLTKLVHFFMESQNER